MVDRAIQVQKLLEELGGTTDEVSTNLHANGIQGVRNAVRFLNPIVRYLQLRLRLDASADVMQRGKVRLRFGDGSKEEVSLPGPVQQFLDAFNRGVYPELEMPQRGNGPNP